MNRRSKDRHSVFSTPQSQKLAQSQSRRSVSSLHLSSNGKCLDETLFDTLMKDPAKRDIVLKLLMQDKHKIEEIKRLQSNQKNSPSTPLNKVKQKIVCESPTALLRRKALEQQKESGAVVVPHTVMPSPLPFERLLEGVVAFVEVKSNNCDRSAAAKALMRAMGAVVKDNFTSDVTHVIFKDGSFNTYQKARLLNAHLVSVLWLEATRRNHARVSEKNYPALGTDTFKINLSLVCEEMQRDYEDLVREELNRGTAVQAEGKEESDNLSRTSRDLTQMRSEISDSLTEDMIDASQDCDAISVISKASRYLPHTMTTTVYPKTPDNFKICSSPELTSDSDSEIGVINGQSVEKVAVNLLELNNRKTTDSNLSDNTTRNSNNSKESTNNGSSESTSLLTNIKVNDSKRKSRRSLYTHVDVEDGLFQSPKMSNRPRQTTVSLKVDKTLSRQANIQVDERELSRCINAGGKNDRRRKTTACLKAADGLIHQRNRAEVDEMELTSCANPEAINDEFVTKRRGRGTLRYSLLPSEAEPAALIKPTSNVTRMKPVTARKSSLVQLAKETSKVSDNEETSDAMEVRKSASTNRISTRKTTSILDSSSPKPLGLKRASDNQENECSATLEKVKNKSTSRRSSSTQELSTLQLSTDSSTNRVPQSKSKEEIRVTNRKISCREVPTKRKSSSSQELLSSLRLSADSQKKAAASTEFNNPSKKTKEKSRKARKSISSSDSSLRFQIDGHEKEVFVSSEQMCSLKIAEAKSDAKEDLECGGRLRKRKSGRFSCSSSVLRNNKENVLRSPDNIGSPEKDEGESLSKKNKSSNCKDGKHKEMETIVRDVDDVSRQNGDGVESDGRSRKTPNGKILVKAKPSSKNRSKGTGADQKVSDSDDSAPMNIRKGRRLYNLDDSIHVRWSEVERGNKKNAPVLFKKPAAPGVFAPQLLTPSTRTYIEILSQRQPTSSSSDENSSENVPNPKPAIKSKKSEKFCRGNGNSTVLNEQLSTPVRKSNRVTKQWIASTSSIGISSQINRRSTLDFVPKIIKTPAKAKNSQAHNKHIKKSSIVCTRFHRPDVQVFQQIVRKLGGFIVEDEVTERTTHLIAGEPKRTINMLRAIARGCWILKAQWLYQSLEMGERLAEEDFELTEFSPAVQQCRRQRQAFGSLYPMDIFEGCGLIYVARSTVPRCSDLQELVVLCKGEVTKIQRNATVIVGDYDKRDGATCVVEKWILDSIMFNKKKTFKNYLIKPK